MKSLVLFFKTGESMKEKRICIEKKTLVHYFISHEEKMLFFNKSDHIFNALPALDLTYHTG